MDPLISVIMPTHNNEATIGVAIDSILKQTYSNLEIIVVNDNSTDRTPAVVEEYSKMDGRVKSFSLPFDDPHRFNRKGTNINAGWMSRNFGIDRAEGAWITFQDADDASLLNRIETQYQIATEYNSPHVCIDWQQFDESLLNKRFDVERHTQNYPNWLISSEEINRLVKQTKGPIFSLIGPLHKFVPFSLKRKFPVRPLFFKSDEPYPRAANSPLVKRGVFEKVRFRPLPERVWPSSRGRGADRDFNFQVAETFRKSISAKIPLYLWRAGSQNFTYSPEQLHLIMPS